MTSILKRVSSDTGPVEVFTVYRRGNTTPLNLSGSTVTLKMRRAGDTENYLDVDCTLVDSGTAGQVQYQWGTAEIGGGTPDLQEGRFLAELEIDFGGSPSRIETSERFEVQVRQGF